MNRRDLLLGAAGAAAAVGVTAGAAAPADAPAPPKRFVIMPDILRCEVLSKTCHDNCWTIHYVWMSRWDTLEDRWQTAHVNSKAYREWLKDYDCTHGIPPHIAFGGAVESLPEGDPDFHARWVRHVKENMVV